MVDSENKPQKVAVLGGSGFVGQRVCQYLADNEIACVSFSRRGKPGYIRGEGFEWAEKVNWLKLDGANTTAEDLCGVDVLVCCVGAPPIPKFTRRTIELQRYQNAEPNLAAINAAEQVGVSTILVVSAQIPWFLRSKFFGYYHGKQQVLEALARFREKAETNVAIAFKPFTIYGRRYLDNGKVIPLDRLLGPFSPLSLGYLLSVEQVAKSIVAAILGKQTGLDLLDHRVIRTLASEYDNYPR